jgi:hypothetical protein
MGERHGTAVVGGNGKIGSGIARNDHALVDGDVNDVGEDDQEGADAQPQEFVDFDASHNGKL